MRIVHVMAWYVPGMGYQENLLTKEQANLGNSVDIVASEVVPDSCKYVPNIEGSSEGLFERGASVDGNVSIHRLSCLKRGGQAILLGLHRKLRELNPDVVQSHGAFSPTTLQAVFSRSLLGYRLFVDDHSLGLENVNHSLVEEAYKFLTVATMRVMHRNVTCYLPVTVASEDLLRKSLRLSDAKLVSLPLGADTDRFHQSSDLRIQGRERVGVSDSDLVLVSAGKFSPLKRTDMLIESFRMVSREMRNARLVLIGSGPTSYMSYLKSVASRFGVLDRVTFLEFMPNSELPQMYNAADIGLWPGLPSITAIEAAACGLPIIVPEGDSSYKILTEYSAAATYRYGSCESLAKSTIELALDPARKSLIGRNAESIVADRLSWKRLAQESIEIYGER